MTKETAIKASNLLDKLAIVDAAIDELYSRDAILDLPADLRHNLIEMVEEYERELKKKLEDL